MRFLVTIPGSQSEKWDTLKIYYYYYHHYYYDNNNNQTSIFRMFLKCKNTCFLKILGSFLLEAFGQHVKFDNCVMFNLISRDDYKYCDVSGLMNLIGLGWSWGLMHLLWRGWIEETNG